jgi:hypothetical protein
MRKARSTRALEPTALTPSRTIITSIHGGMSETHGRFPCGKPMENPWKTQKNWVFPWFFGCLMGFVDDFLKHVFHS